MIFRNLKLDSTLTLKLICQHLRSMPSGKGRGHEHLDFLQRASAMQEPLLLLLSKLDIFIVKQKQWKK